MSTDLSSFGALSSPWAVEGAKARSALLADVRRSWLRLRALPGECADSSGARVHPKMPWAEIPAQRAGWRSMPRPLGLHDCLAPLVSFGSGGPIAGQACLVSQSGSSQAYCCLCPQLVRFRAGYLVEARACAGRAELCATRLRRQGSQASASSCRNTPRRARRRRRALILLRCLSGSCVHMLFVCVVCVRMCFGVCSPDGSSRVAIEIRLRGAGSTPSVAVMRCAGLTPHCSALDLVMGRVVRLRPCCLA